jgi:hypothetical protein
MVSLLFGGKSNSLSSLTPAFSCCRKPERSAAKRRLEAVSCKVLLGLVQERDSGSTRWPLRPGPSDGTEKVYSDLAYSELETLGNISLCDTALDRALLLTSDGSGLLQVISHAGDTTYELAMIAGAFGACRNEVRDCAATWEYCVGHSGITAINDGRRADNRIGAVVVCV